MAIGRRFSLVSAVSFKTLVAGTVVFLSFAIAIVLSGFLLAWVKAGLRVTLGEQQLAALTRTAGAIDRQILLRQNLLKAMAIDLPKGESRQAIQDFLLQQSALKQQFNNFFVFNAQSELLANFNQPAKLAERVFSSQGFIDQTIATGKEQVAIASLESSGLQPLVVFTVPILNSAGQVGLVMVATADFAQLNLTNQLHQLKTSRAGYAYISTEDGTIVAHSDPQRVIKTVSHESGAVRAIRVAAGNTYQMHSDFGSESDAHLISTKALQTGNWRLTAVTPEAELFSSIAQAQATFPALAALLAGLCGLLVWTLMRWRFLPLQELTRRLQQVSFLGPRTAIERPVQADEIGSLMATVDTMLNDLATHQSDKRMDGNRQMLLHALVGSLPIPAFLKSVGSDDEGRIVIWNRAAQAVVGISANQAIGKTSEEVFASKVPSRLAHRPDAPDALHTASACEMRYRHPDGGLRDLRMVSTPFADPSERMTYELTIIEDLTESRRCERELRRRQAELAAVNDASPLGLFCCDLTGSCSYVNRTLENMCGRPQQRLLARGWRRALHPEDRLRMLVELAAWHNHQTEPYSGVCRLRHADGTPIWIAVKVVPVVIDGKANGYVGSIEDITARRTGELALLKSEQRLRLVTDNIPALVAYVTPDERVAFANRRYEEAYGVLHEELFGMYAWELLGPDVYAKSREHIRKALSGQVTHFEREVWRSDSVRYERVSYIPDIDPQGQVAGYYGLVEDITALKQVEAQLRRLVRIDALTGIANRLQFEEKLDDAIRYSRRYQTQMAIMFLDIDHFKAINDTLGHQGGDEVLCEFARRLLGCVRETDTVARLAGDEFVIILEGLAAQEEAQAVAHKIITAMEPAFEIVGTSCKVTTSVGIAVRRDDEDDARKLLSRADDALYLAKSAGRNTYECSI